MLRGVRRLNLPEIEEKVLAFWRQNSIFQKSLERRRGKPQFVFYEGPPTANARPGIHHVIGRVFKDIIPRFKTMRGYFTPRRAGWDTHGLPVEIEVEKELGIKSKTEIEQLGIAEFNRRARESVWRYKEEWEKLTERVGFWLNLDQPYVTYDNGYIEKLWGVLKKIDQRGLLYQGHKVVPWCTRCGTALSSHELAQGYRSATDQSVYVKFRVKNFPAVPASSRTALDKQLKKFSLLVWTTTPWTLPGNAALAVNPKHAFVKVPDPSEENAWLILEEQSARRLDSLLGQPMEKKLSVAMKASDVLKLTYEPLFGIESLQSPAAYKIYPADFVTAVEGTGVVHTAVMYGENDYELGKKYHLPQHHTVDEQGRFTPDVPELAGLTVKSPAAEEKIIEYLKSEGRLLKSELYTHDYPFCWRCETPVLYYATNSWFIAVSALHEQLRAANAAVNWMPAHLKEGRFGEWLREAKDWALSRARYWGTPLPVWTHSPAADRGEKCDAVLTVGSLADLNTHAFRRNAFWIVRHGEADHNLGGWISGDQVTDRRSRLTDRGMEQAEAVARSLKSGKRKIDLIYCSPFRRAKQTAEIIRAAVRAPMIIDRRLAEINGGTFNGRTAAEYHSFYAEPRERFTKHPLGGEHLRDVKKRVMEFIADVNQQHNGAAIVVVSHADPLWMLETGLRGLTDEQALAWAVERYAAVGECRALPFNNWPFNADGELDLHRPSVDDIELKCPRCKKALRRAPEVIDVWFDSGAMPFAGGEYPERYPADYVCEAIDQTRGWFYTLLAIAVLLGEKAPYRNVVSYSHLLDKDGRKMSKSKGNTIDPWEVINRYGIDALRWYFYKSAIVKESLRFDTDDVMRASRQFFSLLHHSCLFWQMYRSKEFLQGDSSPPIHVLDRWLAARLHETIIAATGHLEKYEITEAARAIEVLVDDVSHWYIRRSRKRPAALSVLGDILLTVSKLIAPFTPFFAEALYQTVIDQAPAAGRQMSVHLEDWPEADRTLIDDGLLVQMAEVRQLANAALARRAEAGIRVRQPLAALRIKNPAIGEARQGRQELRIKDNKELLNILAEEVNVKEIVFDKKISDEIELDTIISPALAEEGIVRELARMIQGWRKEQGLAPQEMIGLLAELPAEILETAKKYDERLRKEVHAVKIEYQLAPTGTAKFVIL